MNNLPLRKFLVGLILLALSWRLEASDMPADFNCVLVSVKFDKKLVTLLKKNKPEQYAVHLRVKASGKVIDECMTAIEKPNKFDMNCTCGGNRPDFKVEYVPTIRSIDASDVDLKQFSCDTIKPEILPPNSKWFALKTRCQSVREL